MEDLGLEKLSKDILYKTTLDLSPPDLINLCYASKKMYKSICDSEDFWLLKLRKDYPYFFERIHKPLKNPKKEYIRIFTSVSQYLEKLSNDISDMIFAGGVIFPIEFIKYINIEKFKKDLYLKLYNHYSKIPFELFHKTDFFDESEDIDQTFANLSHNIITDIENTITLNTLEEDMEDELDSNIKNVYSTIIEITLGRWF